MMRSMEMKHCYVRLPWVLRTYPPAGAAHYGSSPSGLVRNARVHFLWRPSCRFVADEEHCGLPPLNSGSWDDFQPWSEGYAFPDRDLKELACCGCAMARRRERRDCLFHLLMPNCQAEPDSPEASSD